MPRASILSKNAIGEHLRFRRDVERLHRLGPRAVYECFAHLGRKHLIRTSIEAEVKRFAGLDPAALAALGGDRFPPAPVHLVQDE